MFCTVMEAYKDLLITMPRVWARMLSCKLLSTAAAFVPLHFVALITDAKTCQTFVKNLCGLESSQMPKPGSWIFAVCLFKTNFKALNTLSNSAEYTITRKRVILFPCLKILLGHSNRCTQCDHQEPSCVYGPAERAENLLLFSPLPLSPLWIPPPPLLRGIRSKMQKGEMQQKPSIML